jgi:predicted metal-dependent hydrolase
VVNLSQLNYIPEEGGSPATSYPAQLVEEALKRGLFISYGENSLSLSPLFQADFPFLRGKSGAYTRFLRSFSIPKETHCPELRRRLEIAAALFNEGFYFECHEYLEGVWKSERGEARLFVKSLIHLAVGMYHLEYGNRKGFTNYLIRAKEELKGFQPRFCGIEVERLLLRIERVLSEAEGKDFTSIAQMPYGITIDLGS